MEAAPVVEGGAVEQHDPFAVGRGGRGGRIVRIGRILAGGQPGRQSNE